LNRWPHASASPYLAAYTLAAVVAGSSLPDASGQTIVTSPPPAQVVIVTNTHAFSLTKHPTLPFLYLTGYGAPGSTNLTTVRLNADGSLMANSQRAWPDYLTTNPTNDNFRYYIPRPVVLAEEKILYLAACQFSPGPYYAETNNSEVAVVGLDDQGQPAKLLRGFRTGYTEMGISALGWDPVSRRLFLSYNTYFGWCQMDKAGLPVSNQFHLLYAPNNFWYYIYVSDWQRFYGYHGNSSLGIAKLTADASGGEFLQYATSGYGSLGNIEVSRRFLKLYMLEGPDNRQIRVYRLTREGRLTAVPRFFPLEMATRAIRFDFKANLLYALAEDGVLKTYHLDSEGYPTGTPQISQLPCSGVRDAVVDEATGKVYVACTQATTPGKWPGRLDSGNPFDRLARNLR
jgi:hypothetical protein